MAIATGKITTQAANGASDWVRLATAKNRLLVSCGTWSTSEVRIDYSDDATTAYPLTEDDLGPLPITDNYVVDINGLDGFIRIVVANYGSTAVTLKVADPIANRP